MTRKQKITLSITGIILVTLILVGLTYGYYLTTIKGNTNTKSITTSLAKLELKYDDGNGLISKENMMPGDKVVKTFSVENKGNREVENYTVYLENIINEFEDKNDLYLNLKCSSTEGDCNGNNLIYPSSDGVIAVNNIKVGEIQSFELTVEFLETNDLQNDNMNKKFEGNVKILDLKNANKKLVTSEGEANVTVSKPELLTNFKIYGNSTQKTRSGKNLINMSDFNVSYTDNYYVNTPTKFKLETGKTYTLSFDYNIVSATKTVAVAVGYGTTTYSKDIIGQKNYDTQTTGRQTVTFNTPSSYTSSDYLFVRFARVPSQGTVNVDISNIQLEEGDMATEYEEYGKMPSPDYPSEIKNVGDLVTDSSDTNYGKYKINIKTTGKNLYPNYNSNHSAEQAGVTQTCNSNKNTITLNGTSNSTGGRNLLNYYNNGFKIEKGKTYTLSCSLISGNTTSGTFNVLLADKNTNEYKGKSCTLGTTATFTATESFTAILGINISKENVTFDNIEVGMIIEENDTATEYEEYSENTANIYLDEPLRKVGDYSDYIDLINKKIVRNIATTKIGDLKNLTYYESSTAYPYGFFTGTPTLKRKNGLNIISNVFQNIQNFKTNKGIFGNSSGGNIYIVDNSYTNVNDFTNALKDGEIYFILDSSNTVDSNLIDIELMDNIKHININTETSPSNIEIGYIN